MEGHKEKSGGKRKSEEIRQREEKNKNMWAKK